MNLVAKLFRSTSNKRDSAKQEGEQINFSSLFTSMENGEKLFNQLKVRCHPDRFAGTDKETIAEHLFKAVQSNRTNYSKMIELKKQIENELYNE